MKNQRIHRSTITLKMPHKAILMPSNDINELIVVNTEEKLSESITDAKEETTEEEVVVETEKKEETKADTETTVKVSNKKKNQKSGDNK